MSNKGSQPRLLPFHKWMFFLIVTFLMFILLFFMRTEEQMTLIIYDQETGEEYKKTSVKLDDEFTVQWEHSVEKEMWQEKLKINKNGEIVLIETRFRSFGSGVPNAKEEGNVYFEDGFLVMTNLQEVKDYYQWIHSQRANFSILKNDEQFLLTSDIPHHHKAEIVIKKG